MYVYGTGMVHVWYMYGTGMVHVWYMWMNISLFLLIAATQSSQCDHVPGFICREQ